MGLRPLEIFLFLQCEDRLQSSESDVYRRQNLTSEVYPRTVRVKGHREVLLSVEQFFFRYENSDWGWNDKQKKEEMSEEKAWYLLAKDESQKPIAMCHFRFDMDFDDEVLYWLVPTGYLKILNCFM